jgi:uncharacterized protein YbcV (DUF1398 family)
MQESTHTAIQSTFEASNNGNIHFGQVIGQLIQAGVESYHIDYRCGRASYFLPNGDTLELRFEKPKRGVHDTFDANAIRSAILGAQLGKVMYPEFKQLTQDAGCAGYTVWIAGRHVTYFGRQGETHVERFPD